MDASNLRDTIIQSLRERKGFEAMAAVDINGFYFKAADVALQSDGGKNTVFRIAVVQHEPQKRFT